MGKDMSKKNIAARRPLRGVQRFKSSTISENSRSTVQRQSAFGAGFNRSKRSIVVNHPGKTKESGFSGDPKAAEALRRNRFTELERVERVCGSGMIVGLRRSPLVAWHLSRASKTRSVSARCIAKC